VAARFQGQRGKKAHSAKKRKKSVTLMAARADQVQKQSIKGGGEDGSKPQEMEA